MDKNFDIDESVNSAIRETERYYREQIFSSGCSSLVPIYRIGDHINKVETLVQQLQGSPYIQKDLVFSEKIVATLLDVNLYRFNNWHFFFQGDIQIDIQQFIEEQCVELASFAQVVQQDFSQTQPKWSTLQNDVDLLTKDFPVMASIPVREVLEQTFKLIREINFHHSVESYLEVFHQPAWEEKVKFNQSSLLCMVAIANKLHWNEEQLKALVTLGFLKDVGYARLNEQISDFEVLHPLVSHKLLVDCNDMSSTAEKITDDVLNSVLLHHEFIDGSGPLSRMRHPLVTKLMSKDMPLIAQISGLCDLYFGFLKDYSPGIAFSITCGFVLGQGEVKPRYSPQVIAAFSDTLKDSAYNSQDIDPEEANKLISAIINLLREPCVRKNTADFIHSKTTSWYERITLALNIVRNIARRQPDQIGEQQLINILQLPVEFGLNY